MSDIFDKEKRSEVMRAVKSKNTKSTELKMMKLFKEYHITGWRRTYPLVGHPDFVFPKKRIAIFVDGCFWHGHNCRNISPETNADYWVKKRKYNMKHDFEVTTKLENQNWRVIRIWECEFKKNNTVYLVKKLLKELEIIYDRNTK